MALEPDLAAVLARARAGDLAAFEEILRRHERLVYAVALRLRRGHLFRATTGLDGAAAFPWGPA